jgi:hypothetical protein
MLSFLKLALQLKQSHAFKADLLACIYSWLELPLNIKAAK